ncbi:sporulation-delaying protein SdpB family protein [Streptomyces olivoreticuli]
MLNKSRAIPIPWANVYGLARTLLALGTAGTLAFSSSATLFRPVVSVGQYPLCHGVTTGGAFCLVPREEFDLARWACVAVLLLVASGWRPRLTAIPHAYISFSVFSGIAIGDGGDQITWILSLLLALVGLGDPRHWHWQSPAQALRGTAERRWALLGTSALVVARLQMTIVYFQASVAKLPHAEWADGSAMFYWANSPTFGAPDWLRGPVSAIVSTPAGVAVTTWAPVALELALAAALLMPQRFRWRLLPLGLLFHLSIALMMGLWSFALAMWAGLLLLLTPIGHSLPLSRRSGRTTVQPESAPELVDTPAKPSLTA